MGAIGLTQLFSGTAHKLNFSTYEINCTNLAMQVIDYTEKAVNTNSVDLLLSDDSSLSDFPLKSLPASDLLSMPPRVSLKYNLSKQQLGYLLLLEVHWVDKNEHRIKYGRFFELGKL